MITSVHRASRPRPVFSRGCAALSFLVVLYGCAGKPPVMPAIEIPTDQVTIQGQLMASPDVNPDFTGRPAPVLVRIYELASDEVFNRVDFFSFFDHEPAVLGPALLRARSFQLAPGQTVDISGNVDPRTQFVGVVAAFRDLDRSRWRMVSPLPPKTARPSEPHRVGAFVVAANGGVSLTVGPGAPAPAGPVSGLSNLGVPTIGVPTIGVPTMGVPTMGVPTMGVPTMGVPTMGVPTMGVPTMGVPTMSVPTMGVPTMGVPTMGVPATSVPNPVLPHVLH